MVLSILVPYIADKAISGQDAESSREKTAFCCSRGLFEINVMPFCLCNAPGKFQELMSRLLRDCSAFALPYLDDIIIFSKSFEDHVKHLELVFSKLSKHKLKLKISKCHFTQAETNYLGFLVNGQGIRPDPNKVQSFQDLPTPTSVRDVRAFIGMWVVIHTRSLCFALTCPESSYEGEAIKTAPPFDVVCSATGDFENINAYYQDESN